MNSLQARVLMFSSNQENELRLVMREVESFAPEILGMQGYRVYDGISEIKRAGWIREQVGIPYHLAESVLEHSMNVKTATESVILGTPQIIEVPKNFPIMGKVHDMPEGQGILPDITPHDSYTKEQKAVLEKYAILYIENVLKKAGELETQLLREYIEQETSDSKILYLLDKIDAGIKALDYEKIGFKRQVAIFHPYNLEKLAGNSYFTKIYEIMLEREFPQIPAHLQYFMLLELAGNYDEWRYRILNMNN